MERVRRKAAFLDRDGTINEKPGEHEYVTRVEGFHLLPGAVQGLTKLADCGYALVVGSNQRGIASGLVQHDLLRATEEVLQQALPPPGAEMAGHYYCPYGLDQD